MKYLAINCVRVHDIAILNDKLISGDYIMQAKVVSSRISARPSFILQRVMGPGPVFSYKL